MRKIAKIFLVTVAIVVVVAVTLAVRIYSFGNIRSNESADAAIVLGAAVWSSGVSPVFRERINHGDYALQSGVPAQDILIEEISHTTYENILYARQVADSQGIKRVLIVSDPLHMKRAVLMAEDVGLIAEPSPTPTTRYQGLKSQVGLLAHETYYYIGYLIRRPFLDTASV